MASVDLIELLLEVHHKVGVSDWAKMNGWDFTSWYDGEPGSAAPSRRPGRVFCSADRTAPPDRTYPEPEA